MEATLFTPSSSSTFLSSPLKPKLNDLSSLTNRPTHLFVKKHLPFGVTSLSLCVPQLDTSLPPAIQTFWHWLQEEGVKTATKPALVPEGTGLVASRDIAENEVVLEVPKRLWIDSDTVSASEIGNVCSGLKPWVSVALFLLRERFRNDSKWRLYIDILPQSTNSTVFWSEKELDELQGTQLLGTTTDAKENVQSEFKKVEEEVILPNKKLFPSPITLDDFFWAFGILKSRAFSRRDENMVLIPLVDFINHSSTVTTEKHAYGIRGAVGEALSLFSIRSPLSVKAGEQVFIQYGISKSNAELALDYGFIDSQASRNVFTLTLQISQSDPFYSDKLDIANSNGMNETANFDIYLDRPLPANMIPYLRLIALGGTDAFLLESKFRNSVWGHLDLPVSRANEELICRVVRDACKSALSAYPTTIEEDEKLKEAELDPRLDIAVRIRAGEKKVLQHLDSIFKERELELDKLEYYQERRLKDLEDCKFCEPKQ